METWAAYNERNPGGFNAAEAGFSLHSLKLLDIITTAHDAMAAGFTDLAVLKKEELLEGASARSGVRPQLSRRVRSGLVKEGLDPHELVRAGFDAADMKRAGARAR